MIVTDKKYYMEKALAEKLYLLAKRVSGKYKHQNVLITDGTEGFGKSTITAEQGYFLAYYLRRSLKLWFDPDKMVDYAIRSEDEILIWDDAAFAALTVEAYNQVIIKLIKAIWLARKKRHTFIINIQEVFRLKELIVSRAIGLTHVYSRDEITLGRFVYFNKKKVQRLYETWQKKKFKAYKKYYSFRGTFPDSFNKIFDETEYDYLKDHAILSIGDNKKTFKDKRIEQLKKLYASMDRYSTIELAERAKVSDRSIRAWREGVFDEDNAHIGDPVPVLEDGKRRIIVNRGYIEPSSLDYLTVVKK